MDKGKPVDEHSVAAPAPTLPATPTHAAPSPPIENEGAHVFIQLQSNL